MEILGLLGASFVLVGSDSAIEGDNLIIPRRIECAGEVIIKQTKLDGTLLSDRRQTSPEKIRTASFSINLTQDTYGSVTGIIDGFAGCLHGCGTTLYGSINADERLISLSNKNYSDEDLRKFLRGENVDNSNPEFHIKIELDGLRAETNYLFSDNQRSGHVPRFKMTSSEGNFFCRF